MMMTWADRIEAKGRAAGRDEGLAEGRKGVYDLVLRLLSQRFGRVPASIKRRIEAISSVQELMRLAESVLQVDSLEEFGARFLSAPPRVSASAGRRSPD